MMSLSDASCSLSSQRSRKGASDLLFVFPKLPKVFCFCEDVGCFKCENRFNSLEPAFEMGREVTMRLHLWF